MKKKIVLFLTMILSLVLLAVGLTIGAASDGDVATNTRTGTGYSSLADAISAASSGDTIDVIADTTVSSTIVITKQVELTSSNGSTVSCSVSNAFTVGVKSGTSGNLTVSGNLIITSTEVQAIQMERGTFTLKDTARISATHDTVCAGVSGTPNDVTINLQGGTVTCTAGSNGKGVLFCSTEGAVINLSGSTVTTSVSGAAAIRLSGKNAKLKMTGGEMSAPTKTVSLTNNEKGKTFTMSGGIVEAKTEKAIYCSGASSTLEISGGTVSAPKIAAYFEKNATGTVTVSGGTVETTTGNQCFYFNQTAGNKVTFTMTAGKLTAVGENTIYVTQKNVADISISGGTVSGTTRVIRINGANNSVTVSGTAWVEATAADGIGAISSNFSADGDVTINIQGGTVSAPSQTIFLQNVGRTAYLNISGGTVIAAQSTLWLGMPSTTTVSGSARIEATDTTAIYVTSASASLNIEGGSVISANDFAVHAKKGTVNISGGTLTAGGYAAYLQGGFTVTVTGGTITAGNRAVFAISSPTEETPSALNISGGIMILNGAGSTHKIISDVYVDGSYCTVTVSGGLFVNNNTANRALFAAPVNGTITVTGGKMLYGDNIFYIVQNATGAPKNAQAVYDANGNGTTDAGETYFFYALFAATDNTHTGTMVPGASARLSTGSNGLRFTANYSASAIAALGQDATYGTIILPTTYLVRVSSFTKAALDAAEIPYLDIAANDGLIDNGDGTCTVRAAITNILTDNFDLSFSAISYAKVGDTYYYAAYNTLDNARSINAVASMALADLKTATAAGYENAVSSNSRTVYSPYTEAQRAVLDAYLPALPTGTAPLTGSSTLTITHEGNLRGWTTEAGYALGNFNVLQGGATDGTYLYYAMENNQSSDDLTQRLGKIVKVDARNGKVVAIGDAITLGHAGGVTYNSDLGYLVVAFGKGNAKRYVAYVDPVDLTLKKVFTGLPEDAKNIAYISAGTNAGKYVVGDGIHFYVATVSNPLTASESWSFGSELGGGEATVAQRYADGNTYNLKYSTKNQPGHQSACVSQDGQYVYFVANPYTATFEGNILSSTHTDDHDYEDYIVIYKISDGSYVGAVRVAATAGETEEYELENVCIIGNQIWLGFHDSFYGEFYHIHTAVVQ